VINVSGHRVGTAEVESALASDGSLVVEAAVVGFPHELKGEGLYAYVVVKDGLQALSPADLNDIRAAVRSGIGPFAAPDYVQVSPVRVGWRAPPPQGHQL
jgi:acetyl-CoA synthetase